MVHSWVEAGIVAGFLKVYTKVVNNRNNLMKQRDISHRNFLGCDLKKPVAYFSKGPGWSSTRYVHAAMGAAVPKCTILTGGGHTFQLLGVHR